MRSDSMLLPLARPPLTNLPQLFRNVDFGTELRNRAVDRAAAHNRIDCTRGVLCSFEVEQDLESTAHKLCFFKVDKNNFGRVVRPLDISTDIMMNNNLNIR